MAAPGELLIYTDGGARRNPGPAGLGVVIYDRNRKLITTLKRYLGVKTNNQAEYEAVIAALERARELGARKISLFVDSELVVNQLTGRYKIKNSGIAALAGKVLALVKNFSSVIFTYIPRERNLLADQLVNEAIDEG